MDATLYSLVTFKETCASGSLMDLEAEVETLLGGWLTSPKNKQNRCNSHSRIAEEIRIGIIVFMNL
eukprot:6456202-Amphidinium_carterae.1